VQSANLYVCPSDASRQASSYSSNGLLAPEPPHDGICPGISAAVIRSPSSTVLFCEAADNAQGGSDDGWLRVGKGANPLTRRHNRGGNFVFCDGHVLWLKPAEAPFPNPDGAVRFEP